MYITKFKFTDEEKKKTLAAFFSNGVLKELPSKEKRKVIIFLELIKIFEKDCIYSEKDVNELIKKVYDDFAIIRRSLIDYKLLERSKDGRMYWVNKNLEITESIC